MDGDLFQSILQLVLFPGRGPEKEGQAPMPTQEERLAALEQTTAEYRPVLQSLTYELTMVKGLIIDQIGITQRLRQDTDDIKNRLTGVENRLTGVDDRLTGVENRLTGVEGKLDTILERLNPS